MASQRLLVEPHGHGLGFRVVLRSLILVQAVGSKDFECRALGTSL